MGLPTPERLAEIQRVVEVHHGAVRPLTKELLGYVEAYREANDALIESNVRTATERNELQAANAKLHEDYLKLEGELIDRIDALQAENGRLQKQWNANYSALHAEKVMLEERITQARKIAEKIDLEDQRIFAIYAPDLVCAILTVLAEKVEANAV